MASEGSEDGNLARGDRSDRAANWAGAEKCFVNLSGHAEGVWGQQVRGYGHLLGDVGIAGGYDFDREIMRQAGRESAHR